MTEQDTQTTTEALIEEDNFSLDIDLQTKIIIDEWTSQLNQQIKDSEKRVEEYNEILKKLVATEFDKQTDTKPVDETPEEKEKDEKEIDIFDTDKVIDVILAKKIAEKKKFINIDTEKVEKLIESDNEAWLNFLTKKDTKLRLTSDKGIISLEGSDLLNYILTKKVKLYQGIESVKKKVKDEKETIKSTAQLFFKNIANNIKQTVTNIKDSAISFVKTTKLAKKTINLKTRITSSKFAGDVAAQKTRATQFAADKTASINKLLTRTGKLLTKVGEVSRVVGNVMTGGILPFGVITLATGNPIIGGLVGLTGGGIKAAESLLNSPNLSSIDKLRGWQLRYGSGQFKTMQGNWNLEYRNPLTMQNRLNEIVNNPEFTREAELLKQKLQSSKLLKDWNSTYSGVNRILRTTNSMLTGGSIGMIVGSLFGNPILGGVIGSGVGATSRIIYDSAAGSALAKIMTGSGNNILFSLPYRSFFNALGSNLWVGSQMDILRNTYKGNVGRYLHESFAFGGSQRYGKLGNVLYSTANVLSLLQVPLSHIQLASRLSTLGATGIIQRFAGMSTGTFAGSTIVSSVLTPVILSALGVPYGPISMIMGSAGAVVGSVAGHAVATAVTVQSGGAGAIVTVPITVTIATGISALFAAIGSFFDRMFTKATESYLGILSKMAVLLQLVSSFFKAFNSDDLVTLAVSLLCLLQTWDKQVEESNQNVLVDEEQAQKADEMASNDDINLQNFSYYNVKFISAKQLTPQQRANIIAILDDYAAELHKAFPNKQIFLTINSEQNAFEFSNGVLLTIDEEKLNNGDIESIKASFTKQTPQMATYPSNLL